MKAKKEPATKVVDTIKHDEATRKNIPTAEFQSVMEPEEQYPINVAYERRNKDLDPQFVWRGKDMKDWSDLVVQAPPLYIQEKVHPKVLIDDLMRQTKEKDYDSGKRMADLFSDFNGVPYGVDKTEFYQHDQHWSNRMILGDSLQVMASLAEREGLRGEVQCIYFDPPYGIKFNSNFQWSTTSRDVKERGDHITREPEQVKAFRDTWRDGINSYLTYLRDRLTIARDLLKDSGSIFVQIGDENMHRVRALMDEVFGDENFVANINFKSTNPLGAKLLPKAYDYIIWYGKNKEQLKFRSILKDRDLANDKEYRFVEDVPSPLARRRLTDEEFISWKNQDIIYRRQKLTSSGFTPTCTFPFELHGKQCQPFGRKSWSTNSEGMARLKKADRLFLLNGSPYYKRFFGDAPKTLFDNTWTDQPAATESIYVVQTATKFIQRCILMTTDPGDLVLDPTCGSGTTATVAEEWGRRWITIDTSRVALTLARTRIMGTSYPYYLLSDSIEGQAKESEVSKKIPSTTKVNNSIRQGFVYERVPHITLKDVANNLEIDAIWDKWESKMESIRKKLNACLKTNSQEWEINQAPEEYWPDAAKELHHEWWQCRIARQKEIDASISANAEFENIYDKPYQDKKRIRVAGPFTVESISPHRTLGVDDNDELIDPFKKNKGEGFKTFAEMVLENLKMAGVQQSNKEDKINFTSVIPWPGNLICAEGRYMEGKLEKRAAIFIGSEFSTVQRIDLVEAAREAGDASFDVLISCAFNYEAHTTEFKKLGRITVLKAKMNADLHMADDLKNTGKGNLFVIFGEPDIEIIPAQKGKIQVKINGVDVFNPSTGEVRSDSAEGIACWFVDTDYNEESFFVRHAYFLGANDPYGSLKASLKTEVNREAWESLHSDISRPFPKPNSGRIAVKVINHLGDEVMKVFKIN